MSLTNKSLELICDAKKTVGQVTHELNQSPSFQQAKSAITNTTNSALTADIPNIKLMNFFAVFSLALMLLSTFCPVMNVFGSRMPLNDIAPIWLYIVTIFALCSHLFGFKQLISRGTLIILLLSTSFTVYQEISDVFQATQMFGSVNRKEVIRGIVEGLRYADVGFYMFISSFVLTVIATIKPGYKTNHALWDKLVSK
ncbi:hypothetical protein H5125_20085 [Shewanella sp. SR44-4]|uniref:hypothetical protein n=1 Tax=Shewanella sp. SR44-4 TaxID=2760935 RepID=UPI0016014662|nr:hypothetical protein [Shewanella sp. SR44-4]MBB1364447.1 hypothetical protein [Shewanella sp. SR44-4]